MNSPHPVYDPALEARKPIKLLALALNQTPVQKQQFQLEEACEKQKEMLNNKNRQEKNTNMTHQEKSYLKEILTTRLFLACLYYLRFLLDRMAYFQKLQNKKDLKTKLHWKIAKRFLFKKSKQKEKEETDNKNSKKWVSEKEQTEKKRHDLIHWMHERHRLRYAIPASRHNKIKMQRSIPTTFKPLFTLYRKNAQKEKNYREKIVIAEKIRRNQFKRHAKPASRGFFQSPSD